MEIALILIAIGALALGHKLGMDSGKSAGEHEVFMRIQSGLADYTEFHRKYGVQGLYLSPPVGFPVGASFVIIDDRGFQELIEQKRSGWSDKA